MKKLLTIAALIVACASGRGQPIPPPATISQATNGVINSSFISPFTLERYNNFVILPEILANGGGSGGNTGMATNVSMTGTAAATNDSRSLVLTNAANQFAGTYIGNGSGLTNIQPSGVTNAAGFWAASPAGSTSPNVVTNTQANVTNTSPLYVVDPTGQSAMSLKSSWGVIGGTHTNLFSEIDGPMGLGQKIFFDALGNVSLSNTNLLLESAIGTTAQSIYLLSGLPGFILNSNGVANLNYSGLVIENPFTKIGGTVYDSTNDYLATVSYATGKQGAGINSNGVVYGDGSLLTNVNLASGIALTNATIYGDGNGTNRFAYGPAGIFTTNSGSQVGRSVNLAGASETYTGTNGSATYITYTPSNNTVVLGAANANALTNLNASNLTGTVPLAQLPAVFNSITASNVSFAATSNSVVPAAGNYTVSTAVINTNIIALSGSDIAAANANYYWFSFTNAYTNAGSPLYLCIATNLTGKFAGDMIAVSNWVYGTGTNRLDMIANTNMAVFIAPTNWPVGQWILGTNGNHTTAPYGSFGSTNLANGITFNYSIDGTNVITPFAIQGSAVAQQTPAAGWNPPVAGLVLTNYGGSIPPGFVWPGYSSASSSYQWSINQPTFQFGNAVSIFIRGSATTFSRSSNQQISIDPSFPSITVGVNSSYPGLIYIYPAGGGQMPGLTSNTTNTFQILGSLIVTNTITATNGIIIPYLANIPSNSILGYSGTSTNWWIGNYAGACCAICTNNGANTYTIKQLAP
jgi:hypothetical protein